MVKDKVKIKVKVNLILRAGLFTVRTRDARLTVEHDGVGHGTVGDRFKLIRV